MDEYKTKRELQLEREWEIKNDGSGGFWENVKRGALQGVKEFFANPFKHIKQAGEDFDNADQKVYGNK